MVSDFLIYLAAIGATRPPKTVNSNSPKCLYVKDTPLPRDLALNFVVTHIRLLISVGYKMWMPILEHSGLVLDLVIICFRPLNGWLKRDDISQAARATPANKPGRWVTEAKIDHGTGELEVHFLMDVKDLVD
jgi:hypothetical protein